jgi:hypothetical protein
VRSSLSGPGTAGPDRAEHLVAGADRDRHARHGERVGALAGRLDEDRPVAAVQLAEDAALVEDPRVPLRDLAAQDRLDPGRVGLVLAAREREHPRAAVLDRDRCVQQRGDRVGDGEQVARRQPAQRLGLGHADVALGEQRAQHRGQVRPRCAAAQAEQRDPRRVRRGPDVRGQRNRCAQHQAGSLLLAELDEQLHHPLGSSTPTPRTSASRG